MGSSTWGRSRVRAATIWSVRAATTSRRKVARAWLWGSPVARARSRARSQVAGSRRSRWPPTSTTMSASGTRWRSVTAAASTSTMRMSPLTAATSTGSWAVAVTPGNRSPTVDSSTSVSPSEGSTCSM